MSPCTFLKSKQIAPISNRQGGSATDWETPGTTDYVPSGATMQCGRVSSIFGGTPLTITFPTPFSYKPLVFVTLETLLSSVDVQVYNITASTFDLVVTGGATFVSWLAIGPKV